MTVCARTVLLAAAIVVGVPGAVRAQAPAASPAAAPAATLQPAHAAAPLEDVAIDLDAQWASIREAALAVPLAAALGAALAFRPRRRGTPERSAPVIQTQIILAIVGSMVMLIVGASLARAFGIVGAASLVRYRAKVDDPKDAGVMLSTLTLGLATGVGLHALAVGGTLFVMAVLWAVESLEPVRRKAFALTVKTPDPGAVRPEVERLLRRAEARFELRTNASDELSYEVLLPYEQRTDRLSTGIAALAEKTAVEWEEKKAKT